MVSNVLKSKAEKFVVSMSLIPKGNINMNPNRKTQLITVNGLYFVINGFTKIKYKAYEHVFKKTNKLPVRELVPSEVFPYHTKKNAPIPPKIKPRSLRDVIFSFINTALNIITITGTDVMIIEASIGEVKFNP